MVEASSCRITYDTFQRDRAKYLAIARGRTPEASVIISFMRTYNPPPPELLDIAVQALRTAAPDGARDDWGRWLVGLETLEHLYRHHLDQNENERAQEVKRAGAEVLPGLLSVLSQVPRVEVESVVWKAMDSVGWMGAPAETTVPPLVILCRRRMAPALWAGRSLRHYLSHQDVIDTLLELAAETRGDSRAVFKALAEAKERASEIIPRLEQLVDPGADPRFVNQKALRATLRTLKSALKPPRKKSKGAGGDPFLRDLVSRLADYNDSQRPDSPHATACRELKKLDDPAFIPKIIELWGQEMKADERATLVDVLGTVTRQSASEEGRRFIFQRLGDSELPDRLWENFLEQAALCEIPGAGHLVETRIRSKPLDAVRGDMRMRVCDYFAAVHDESGIPLMVELAELQSDKFLTMQSLLKLNPDAAIPHLMRWAETGSVETMQWATHFLCEHSRGRPHVMAFLESELLRNRKSTRSFCIRTLSQSEGVGVNASILQTLERLVHEVRKREVTVPGAGNADKALLLCLKHFAGPNRTPASAEVVARLMVPDMWARLTDAEKEVIGLSPLPA